MSNYNYNSLKSDFLSLSNHLTATLSQKGKRKISMFLYRKKNRVNQGNLSFNNEVTLGKVRQWSKERNSCFADLYLFEFLRCNELLFQNTVPILAAVKNGKLFSTFCKNSFAECLH